MPTDNPQPAPSAARPETTRILRFIAVGVLNTAFGYAVFAVLWLATHNHNLAVVLSTLVGVAFNYFTVGRLVFANRGLKAAVPFVLGYAVVLVVNIALLDVLVQQGITPLLAQLLATPVLVTLAYLINRFVVFRGNWRS